VHANIEVVSPENKFLMPCVKRKCIPCKLVLGIAVGSKQKSKVKEACEI